MQMPARAEAWLYVIIAFVSIQSVCGVGKVIFAVNCGGEAHVDSNGIRYQKDSLEIGTASDYGRQYLTIGRVSDLDAVLYQTERYHHANFGYDIPITEDGDYVLVLKFCEVYFNSPGMKVFDVTFNIVHTIVSYLDIFERVGKAVAYDEYIPFKVSKEKVLVNDEESELSGKKIRVEFIKGNQDNPKVNAIFVMKGQLEDVPKIADIGGELDDEEREEKPLPPKEELDNPPALKKKRNSNSKIPDPYLDDSSTMLPLFVAIAAVVPFLFCLCKL